MNKDFGHRGRFHRRQSFRDRQARADRRDAKLRVAAPRDQGAKLLSNQFLGAIAGLDDFAGELEAENVGRPRRRRIEPAALQNVRAIDPRRLDLDQDLAWAGSRDRTLDQRQLLRAVGLRGNHGQHRGGNSRHAAAY